MTRGRGKKEAREAFVHDKGGKMPKPSSRAWSPKSSSLPPKACGHKGGICRQGSKR